MSTKQAQTEAQKLEAQKARNAAQTVARNAVPAYNMASAIKVLNKANPFTRLHASGKINNRHSIFAILVKSPTLQAHYTACKAAKLRTGMWDAHNAVTKKHIALTAPK